jgi:hypothetical protein
LCDSRIVFSVANVTARKQTSTIPTTIEAIMGSPYFGLGAADQRAGRGFPADYEVWRGNNQWSYERGRAWAVLAPRSVKLRLDDGRLNPRAVAHWSDDIL